MAAIRLARYLQYIFFILAMCLLLCPDVVNAYSFRDDPCFTASARVERMLHIPEGFLYAISRVETSQSELRGGTPTWPWTVNAEGEGHHYVTEQEAIDAVEAFQRRGATRVDVGCMQVDIHHHPDAFISLQQAFDPFCNTLYAGKFLRQLRDKMQSWPRAAASYHSQTPQLGEAYQWKVLQAWSLPQAPMSSPTPYAVHPAYKRPPIARPLEPFAPYVTDHGATLGAPHRAAPAPNVGDSVRVPENGERNRTLRSYRMHPTRKATALPMRTTPY